MNILICSAGKHGKLIQDFKRALSNDSRIIIASYDRTAPSLYFGDKYYLVPDVKDSNYIEEIMKICKSEKINAITTMLDIETLILAQNRNKFSDIGVEVLTPFLSTAELCFDKFLMYQFLVDNNIKTMKTFGDIEAFNVAFDQSQISFPVFVKPRSGRGSVGARKVDSYDQLKKAFLIDKDLIAQEFIEGIDIDADVYVDTINQKPVSIFMKKKLQTSIGGASKTLSFLDDKLVKFIEEIVSNFQFNGPINMDFFYKDGEYYLTEINPRFGATYLHAWGSGINFMKLIENNINKIKNDNTFGDYEKDTLMITYSSAIILKKSEFLDEKDGN